MIFKKLVKKIKRMWLVVPAHSKENEWGLPIIRLSQGRDVDYYDLSQIKKVGTKKW